MLLAWHSEPELKATALAHLNEHRRLDRIVQGVYWSEGRGCNLGCLTHCDDDAHNATVRMFGLELSVAYFLEAVFEGLPQDDAPQWAIDSAEAIPVGADLSRFSNRFCAWLLGESGLLCITDVNREAIETVAALHRRAAAGGGVTDDEWAAARSAAESAAAWAAWKTIAAKALELFATSPVPHEQCPEAQRC